MSSTSLHTVRSLMLAGLAFLITACASTPQNSTEVLARSAQAMGATQLKTLRYVAEGTGYTFGQPFSPDGPSPMITVHSMIRTLDYHGGAMRDEILLSRAEPLVGQQRNDQYISGEVAWNQVATAVTPGSRWVADRIHQLWITPHGAIKAAMRNGATARRGAQGGSEVSFTEPGRLRATVTISADGLVTQVSSVAPDPVLGDTPTVTTYSDYQEVGGIRFPGRIRQTMGGFQVLDVTTIVVQAASVPFFDRALAKPNSVRPDLLAESGRKASVLGVGERFELGDASRSIELHRLIAGPHSDSFLLVYLPRERLLIQADAFTPGPPGSAPPAVPNANHVSLVANIERLKLPVERILPLHGRMVPLAELYTAVGRPAPARGA